MSAMSAESPEPKGLFEKENSFCAMHLFPSCTRAPLILFWRIANLASPHRPVILSHEFAARWIWISISACTVLSSICPSDNKFYCTPKLKGCALCVVGCQQHLPAHRVRSRHAFIVRPFLQRPQGPRWMGPAEQCQVQRGLLGRATRFLESLGNQCPAAARLRGVRS